jgi:hypothetical protein
VVQQPRKGYRTDAEEERDGDNPVSARGSAQRCPVTPVWALRAYHYRRLPHLRPGAMTSPQDAPVSGSAESRLHARCHQAVRVDPLNCPVALARTPMPEGSCSPPDRGRRPYADLRRTTPAVDPRRVHAQPPDPPARPRAARRRPLQGADQAPTRPRRPYQRI